MDSTPKPLQIPEWVLQADEDDLLRLTIRWLETTSMGEATSNWPNKLADELDQIASDIKFRGTDSTERIAATGNAMGIDLRSSRITKDQWGAVAWASRFGLNWGKSNLVPRLGLQEISNAISRARTLDLDLTRELQSALELCKNQLVGKVGDAIKLINSKSSDITNNDLRHAVLVVTNEVLRLRRLLPDVDDSKLLDLPQVIKLSVPKFFRYFDSVNDAQWPLLKEQFQQWLSNLEGTTLKSAEANSEFASGVTERAKRLGFRFQCQQPVEPSDMKARPQSQRTSALCGEPSGLRWMKVGGMANGAFHFGHLPPPGHRALTKSGNSRHVKHLLTQKIPKLVLVRKV